MTDFRVPNPYAALPELPALEVTSESFTEGAMLGAPQLGGKMGVEGGLDKSPQVSWPAGPEGTQSYVVTVFDPDAPTASGFWHWSVANIPAHVTSLPEGACTGEDTSGLPEGAVVVRNDAGFKGFVGAAPPQGHGPHRYILAVHAVGGQIDLHDDASCAYVGFNLFEKGLARGTTTAIYEQ
ncbi:YbhB/YbcL family Raf kinase inhibitor-like protein [Rhodococcus sp. IEGM 1408]|uniref:YbhB/YbcL family Raf kinase inhibitor-like protein n=1 Tax=Rhodococcus sp. IEGM 1408 TaxID=3082220 RepID=UPI002954BC13|nr:YbhB/YbcL family Raf kinase inhibitor-like protein [Rhodococcus sp. IEGM 1408]MDV8000222.1 YbhB/YbcL family Raf kinase inhibitor-like protein [Rhodococcus sp. IEGM 1408]